MPASSLLPKRGAGRRRSVLSRGLLLALLAVAARSGGAAEPLDAPTWALPSEDAVVLEGEDLTAAAAECGIGIAGERHEPVAAAAGMAVPGGEALGKWVLGLVGSYVKGQVTRRVGLDEQYNRFLLLSRQLQVINSQLAALDERFDELVDLVNRNDLRNAKRDFNVRYVDPVRNGMEGLRAVTCEEAAVRNAHVLFGEDSERAKQARSDLDLAVRRFGEQCTAPSRYADIAANVTRDFTGGTSLLQRFLETAILPRRYLTRSDSVELEDFFYTYHLVQVQALRLTAECLLRFPDEAPTDAAADDRLRRSVQESVFGNKQTSDLQRAKLARLPEILPELLHDDVMLDWETRLLWWNGTYYGAHPHVNRRGLIQDRTIHLEAALAGPNGIRAFPLATFAEVERLAPLGAAMPSARRNRSETGRYPATLAEFLQEIGLDRVAERVPETGPLSFIWVADVGKPIRRCHSRGSQACIKWYDPHDALGHSAAAVLARGPSLRVQPGNAVLYAPQGCPPDECRKGIDSYRWRDPNVISLCADPKDRDRSNRCIPDAVLGMWQAPGIYRAALRPDDDFFAIDLSPLE